MGSAASSWSIATCPVGAALARVHVLVDALAAGAQPRHRLGRVDELAGAGNHDDAADLGVHVVDRAMHLERQLRQAVAEVRQRQVLEHDVGDAAIGRRQSGAFARDDQASGSCVSLPV